MASYWQKYRDFLFRREVVEDEPAVSDRKRAEPGQTLELEIAPDDPLMAYLLKMPGIVDVDELQLDSPALLALKKAGVKISVPLVSQGELIGLLNLGARRSEQEYSLDDRRLLSSLAAQAAPVLRVAQLARQQQAEARKRERIEHELRVARVIQQTLLPKELPSLPGWEIKVHWQPAQAVSGDFYDFVKFSDGRLGILIGDVTDKGVPAALVMATTRSVLRSAAERQDSPGAVLQQANDLLCPDIPANMYVTCLYGILDPSTGRLVVANAGHNLPYRCTPRGLIELRATGVPLGLMSDVTYEEKETTLFPGESLVFYSDGLVEAHNPQGEIFGFPRLRSLLDASPAGVALVDFLVTELERFTGAEWEQEDDVTLMAISYNGTPFAQGGANTDQVLAEFELKSQPGNERLAMEQVAGAVRSLNLSPDRLERLKTAVAEGTMNAMEHGNRYREELPVTIRVSVTDNHLLVQITDYGGDQPIPDQPEPDLEAKLHGLQSPRGWGLFLIKNMVDELRIKTEEQRHTLELIFRLEGA